MIAFVRGAVVAVGSGTVTVDIGSVGMLVHCPASTSLTLRAGDRVELLTSLVVREDAWTLYGFADPDARDTFEQVQTVAGIGPRIALALVDVLPPDELRRAVHSDDETTLMRVPGIGRKGAQRLIVELRDRLAPPTSAAPTAPGPPGGGWQAAVTAGLTSLGWTTRDAEQAVASVDADRDLVAAADGDVGVLLKAALRALDRS
jgi:Holliday junction DNA helicase RuvA